jgi:hypothetical protein
VGVAIREKEHQRREPPLGNTSDECTSLHCTMVAGVVQRSLIAESTNRKSRNRNGVRFACPEEGMEQGQAENFTRAGVEQDSLPSLGHLADCNTSFEVFSSLDV